MRVVMTSPYSLSRPGGVQGQVLGLARELRKLGVDVRVVGPCDGPPPEPGVVSVGPSVEWNSNGSVAPISPGRATARRTAEVMRSIEPDLVHLHEPAVPGPVPERAHRVQRPDGRHVPRVGRAAPHVDAPGAAVADGAVERARRGVGVGARDRARQLVRRRVRRAVERHRGRALRVGDPDAHRRGRPRSSSGATSRARGSTVLLDAWRTLDRDAVLWVGGAGLQTDELRASGRGAPTSSGSARSPTPSATRACAARPCCARRRCTASRSASCCSRAWPRARPWSRRRSRATATSPAPIVDALLVPPGDVDALRDALRRVFDDAGLRDRLVAAGRARADEFSMARLAERYLELYERVAGPRAMSR